MDQTNGKIFGIGLSRTGTTSLGIALLSMGLRTAHYVIESATYHKADAILDAPVYVDFEVLDQQYPGSRFIYTDRDPDDWVRSFRVKLLDGPMNQRQETEQPTHPAARMNQRVYRELFGRIDGLTDDVLRRGYLRHRNRVMDYFADRPDDLLVIEIGREENGAIWERLSEFVGVKLPGTFPAFPNQSAMLWLDVDHPCKVVDSMFE